MFELNFGIYGKTFSKGWRIGDVRENNKERSW